MKYNHWSQPCHAFFIKIQARPSQKGRQADRHTKHLFGKVLR